MSEHPTADSRTDHWRSHIEAWQATGGGSQMAYCKTHELSYSQFIYWRRKFQQPQPSARALVQRGFVPVTHARPTPPGDLTVVLPNGLELRGITTDNLPLAEQLLDRWS